MVPVWGREEESRTAFLGEEKTEGRRGSTVFSNLHVGHTEVTGMGLSRTVAEGVVGQTEAHKQLISGCKTSST